jgi:5-bromo-4-chloroindolyl phosphate hydrolysis protein
MCSRNIVDLRRTLIGRVSLTVSIAVEPALTAAQSIFGKHLYHHISLTEVRSFLFFTNWQHLAERYSGMRQQPPMEIKVTEEIRQQAKYTSIT